MPATRMDIQHGEPMMLEEETNTPGSYEAMFPSHRQVPNRDSKSKWWWPVWRQWRSQSWENCEHHTGRASKCGEISPTFEMQLQDLDKQQNNLLPSGQSVPPCQQPQPAHREENTEGMLLLAGSTYTQTGCLRGKRNAIINFLSCISFTLFPDYLPVRLCLRMRLYLASLPSINALASSCISVTFLNCCCFLLHLSWELLL